MLCCNETVTLARCVNGTSWVTEVIEDHASWFSKSIGSMTDKGFQGSREIHCRIPAAYTPEMFPKIGDYVIRGTVTSLTGLSDLKGCDYGKITNVSDNRRFGPAHVSVVAS